MNSRSYYRNSILAFPKTSEYGCAVEFFKRRPSQRLMVRVYAAALAVVLMSVGFWGAPA